MSVQILLTTPQVVIYIKFIFSINIIRPYSATRTATKRAKPKTRQRQRQGEADTETDAIRTEKYTTRQSNRHMTRNNTINQPSK